MQPDLLAELARDIDRTCRLTGSFTLRSGQTATEYFDKYLFESDPQLLRRVAEAMQPLVPEDTDLLGGLELGGVPLATMISSITGIPALFVRKKAKEYGTRRLAEGADVAGRRITIVEDIVTTGGAVRDATHALRAAGAAVQTVICAIDRSPTPGTALSDIELTTLPLLTRGDLDHARQAQAG
ncbi:orotate phosphoribosyltransferase [Pedococcus sp. KACC 23699]|uniref:Orotate phosphoribosyltransferase n=1 Tax=Pedococcus sp. KACC 23699 TaxID=3149228 RepID=A0AAU7JWL7_9MICO